VVAKLLDNIIEVKESISSGDRVVNNPTAALLDGSQVRVVTPEPGYDLVAGEGATG